MALSALASALLPIGGDLLGGALSAFGGSSNYHSRLAHDIGRAEANVKYEEAKQMRTQDQARQDWYLHHGTGAQMRDIFNTADQSGIHRLAALGASPASYTPSATVGAPSSTANIGPDTDRLGFLGDAVGKAVGNYTARKAAQSADKRANAESKSRVELNEAEAELIRAQSRTTIQNARATNQGSVGPTVSSEAPQQGMSELIKGTDTDLKRANPDAPSEIEQDLSAFARTGPGAGGGAWRYLWNIMKSELRGTTPAFERDMHKIDRFFKENGLARNKGEQAQRDHKKMVQMLDRVIRNYKGHPRR